MKKLYLITTTLFSGLIYSQCTIVGNSTINITETETYQIENDNAQCTDCHLWVTIGGNAQLEGDFRKNSIRLKPTAPGRTVLSLAILTSQGLSQCSKNIDIVDGNQTSPIAQAERNINCDIAINSFREVKYSENIVTFFPSDINNEYKYTWTVSYSTGEQKTSTEKIPQFPYMKENEITSVKVKIVSSKCMKDLGKSYDNNYWKFF